MSSSNVFQVREDLDRLSLHEVLEVLCVQSRDGWDRLRPDAAEEAFRVLCHCEGVQVAHHAWWYIKLYCSSLDGYLVAIITSTG